MVSPSDSTISKPGRDGFTLIETMVAMVVLSIGLLALAAVIPMLKSDLTHSGQRTTAVILAVESAEWLQGFSYRDPLLTAGLHEDPDFSVPGYTKSWEVEENVPFPSLKRITVKVERDNQSDESASVIFLHAEAGR